MHCEMSKSVRVITGPLTLILFICFDWVLSFWITSSLVMV